MSWIYRVSLVVSIVSLNACSSGSASLVVRGSSVSTATSLTRNQKIRGYADEGPSIGSPSSTTMKMYALYISTQADCSSPTLVQDYGSDGVDKDVFESGVTLFEGSPADGDYQCLIIKMSDVIRFKADSEAVNAASSPCSEGTEYSLDIYRTDSGDSWKDVNGAAITPHGASGSPEADTVYIFVSRNPSAIPSTTAHENQVGTLGSSLVVPGQATFYADGSHQVTNNDGSCGLNGLTLGFQ